MSLPTIDGALNPLGFQQITVLTSAVGLTVPTGATIARIQSTGQNVRWRDDGSDPTPTVGMELVKQTVLVYAGDLDTIKFIEATATAVLNVSYYNG